MTESESAKDKSADRGLEDGKVFAASGILLDQLADFHNPPFIQPTGQGQEQGLILVNGIGTDAVRFWGDLEALVATGVPALGIHYATRGIFEDLVNALLHKSGSLVAALSTRMHPKLSALFERFDQEQLQSRFDEFVINSDILNSPAFQTIKKTIARATENGYRLRLAGHSLGALLISHALLELSREWPSQCVAERLSLLTVETYGGASRRFVDGPSYYHIINDYDPVPILFGLGHSSGVRISALTHPGRNARIYHFKRFLPITADRSGEYERPVLARIIDATVHNPRTIYFPERSKALSELDENLL